jgi:hypothetical protein
MQMDLCNEEDSETIADYSSNASPKVVSETTEASDATFLNSQPDFQKEEWTLDAVGSLSDTGATVASSDYNSYISDFSSDRYCPLNAS